MNIVIIIPTANRLELLKACISSIFENIQKLSSTTIKILVGFNDDKSGFSDFYLPNVEKFLFQKSTPSMIRNELILKISKDCDYILFLDDDIILPKNYLLDSINFLRAHPVSVLGGSDSCYPGVGEFEEMINYTIQSPMVTSATRVRHIVQDVTTVTDESGVTLSNLWINADIFRDEYKFNINYFRNEENVLIDELIRNNYEVMHLSKLFVYHKRRSSIEDFWYPSFRSGYFRMKSLYERPNHKKAIFLIPLTFLYFNIIVFICCQYYLLLPLLLYMFGVFIYSLKILFKTQRISYFCVTFCLQPFLILMYALGQFSFFVREQDNE